MVKNYFLFDEWKRNNRTNCEKLFFKVEFYVLKKGDQPALPYKNPAFTPGFS